MSLFSIPAPLRSLEEIDLADRLIDQFPKSYEGITRAKRGPAREIRAWWRKMLLRRGSNARAALASVDLADPAAVLAEIGGDVVLAIAAEKHALHNRNLLVRQGHEQILRGLKADQNASSNPSWQRA